MRPSLWDYVREAFNARPIGMFFAPNWAMLGAFGLAGVAHDPAWLVLGAGVELGYLLLLGTNTRFQRFVAGKLSAGGNSEAERKLTWMYLRLLVTRQGIQRVLREGGVRAPGDPPPVPGSGTPGMSISGLENRLAELKRRLAEPSLSDDLRRSL